MTKPKIIRTSTVPTSLAILLKGQLKKLNEHYEIVALSSAGEPLQLVAQREGVRTIEVAMERKISIFKDFASLLKLIVLFAKEKPQMVHSITPKAGLLTMLAGWITRVPVRAHTFTGLIFPTSKGIKKKILIAMDRLSCSCATHIYPEGQGVKNDLINYHITSKPLHIIANGNVNGIDLTHYAATPEVVEKAQAYKKEDLFTFCFIGRLVRDKGINELVTAFERLYQENPAIRLLLVGTLEQELDPLKPEVIRAIENHPGIEAVGFQSDVRPFLVASDLFVFPSYREGFPNVLLQAGALEVASIVTDINGSNEIVKEGENGVIIPSQNEEALFDAMKQAVENPQEVERMAATARELIASRYDQKVVWEALLQEYKRIIK
ncbi:MAG: glycosyltransferase family 4 protein [Phocaeicola sp.]